MKLKVVVKLALKHLRVKKLRTIVTVGGMSIGVGVIVFLLSFGFGLQQLVTDQLVNLNSINTIDVTSQKSRVLSLDPANVSDLKSTSGVKEVTGLFSTAGKMSFGGSTTDVVVYGVTKRYLELSDVHTSTGNSLSEAYQEDNLEVLVNTVALETIGISTQKDAVGKVVDMNLKFSNSEETKTVKLKVVGVVEDNAGSFVYLHEEILRGIGLENYSQVLVLAENRDLIPEIRTKIENKGFTTASPIDTLNQINQVFRVLNIFLAGLGTIGLLIAAGGMFNTLTVSLLERTREIALMKILGARQKDIGRLFLAEAILMTFFGGLLGILFAFALGFGLNTWLNVLASQRGADLVTLFRIPILFGLFIIVFSVILGLLTAIYPARRGMKINPLQALKHE